MKRVYQVFGGLLLALYSFVELTGRELPSSHVMRGSMAPGARNNGGFRTYHSWNGGK
jgi:hypothetical protein